MPNVHVNTHLKEEGEVLTHIIPIIHWEKRAKDGVHGEGSSAVKALPAKDYIEQGCIVRFIYSRGGGAFHRNGWNAMEREKSSVVKGLSTDRRILRKRWGQFWNGGCFGGEIRRGRDSLETERYHEARVI